MVILGLLIIICIFTLSARQMLKSRKKWLKLYHNRYSFTNSFIGHIFYYNSGTTHFCNRLLNFLIGVWIFFSQLAPSIKILFWGLVSDRVISSTPCHMAGIKFITSVVSGVDCIDKSNFHIIVTMVGSHTLLGDLFLNKLWEKCMFKWKTCQ